MSEASLNNTSTQPLCTRLENLGLVGLALTHLLFGVWVIVDPLPLATYVELKPVGPQAGSSFGDTAVLSSASVRFSGEAIGRWPFAVLLSRLPAGSCWCSFGRLTASTVPRGLPTHLFARRSQPCPRLPFRSDAPREEFKFLSTALASPTRHSFALTHLVISFDLCNFLPETRVVPMSPNNSAERVARKADWVGKGLDIHWHSIQ